MMKNSQLIILYPTSIRSRINKNKNKKEVLSLFTANAHGKEGVIHVYLDTKLLFFDCTTLMEKEAGVKNNNSEIRNSFLSSCRKLVT